MMKEKTLKLLTIHGTSSLAVLKDDKMDFSTISFEKGYGSIVKAGIRVQGCVTAAVNVDMILDTYSTSSYKETTNDYSTFGNTEITEHLRESERTQDYKDWWFWLFSASGKDHDHYKDSTSDTVSINDEKLSTSLKNNFSEKKQSYKVSGTFHITSNRYIPTDAYLYIELLNITTKDGSTTTVISPNSQPIVADQNGSTEGLEIAKLSRLHIVPISSNEEKV